MVYAFPQTSLDVNDHIASNHIQMLDWYDGQDLFYEFEKQARALAAKYDDEILKRDYPGTWLLLNMEK